MVSSPASSPIHARFPSDSASTSASLWFTSGSDSEPYSAVSNSLVTLPFSDCVCCLCPFTIKIRQGCAERFSSRLPQVHVWSSFLMLTTALTSAKDQSFIHSSMLIMFLNCFCHGMRSLKWQSGNHRVKFTGNLTVTPSGSSLWEPDLLPSQSLKSWKLEAHIPHMVTENKARGLQLSSLVQQHKYPPFGGHGTILCSLNWDNAEFPWGSYFTVTDYYLWIGVTTSSSGNCSITLLFLWLLSYDILDELCI